MISFLASITLPATGEQAQSQRQNLTDDCTKAAATAQRKKYETVVIKGTVQEQKETHHFAILGEENGFLGSCVPTPHNCQVLAFECMVGT